MKKDVIYFQHDYNARRDPKVISLITDYGYEGYGRYWALIEILREQEGYIQNDRNNLRAIAFELRVDVKKLQKFLKDLVSEYKLLSLEDNLYFSKRLLESIGHLDTIRKKRQEAIDKRWKKKKEENGENESNSNDLDTIVLQKNNTCNTIELQNDTKNRIEYNRIEKNSIVNNSIVSTPIQMNSCGSNSEVSHCFALWNKPNPNLAETQVTENLINQFTFDNVLRAFRIAAEQNKTNIAYVRGILLKEMNGDIKDNGTNSKIYNNGSNYPVQKQGRGSVEPGELAESIIRLYGQKTN